MKTNKTSNTKMYEFIKDELKKNGNMTFGATRELLEMLETNVKLECAGKHNSRSELQVIKNMLKYVSEYNKNMNMYQDYEDHYSNHYKVAFDGHRMFLTRGEMPLLEQCPVENQYNISQIMDGCEWHEVGEVNYEELSAFCKLNPMTTRKRPNPYVIYIQSINMELGINPHYLKDAIDWCDGNCTLMLLTDTISKAGGDLSVVKTPVLIGKTGKDDFFDKIAYTLPVNMNEGELIDYTITS